MQDAPPPRPSPATKGADPVASWIHGLRFEDLPPAVVARARTLLLDTLGVAAAAGVTGAARVGYELALDQFRAPEGTGVRLPFDGRAVSAAGAAFALATRIDSLDAHDGFQPAKGHAGAALVPTLLALGQTRPAPGGRSALTALVAGYEIAARAGIALHATMPAYHGSGAWNAIGAAALGAHLRRFDGPVRVARALGIAEYHAPRAPMMREIDAPSMLHDSSGWGALAGTTAVALAARGFTASPAELTAAAAGEWSDLGMRWRLLEQYLKPHPVCYWAQSAVRAALALRAAHDFDPGHIRRVRIETFHEATRLYAGPPPSTEVAQYALAFPVAVALATGRLGPAEIAGDALADPVTGGLVARIEVREHAAFSERFPSQRLAAVTIERDDGVVLRSGPTQPRGVPGDPLDDDALAAKYHEYAEPALGPGRATALAEAVAGLAAPDADLGPLLGAVTGDAPG